jgi:hypothetical protein
LYEPGAQYGYSILRRGKGQSGVQVHYISPFAQSIFNFLNFQLLVKRSIQP